MTKQKLFLELMTCLAVGSDSPRAKEQTDPAGGHVRRAAEKGLWQDVEFVPKIVGKIGD